MLYHASPVGGIRMLEPRVSNHGVPRVYFSDRRENTLVYLSNAVEKCWLESGGAPKPRYAKWGSYGFTRDGLLCLDEYWPDAFEDTYAGVLGFVYAVEEAPARTAALPDIPHAFFSQEPVAVAQSEFVPDAWTALLQAREDGLIVLRRYEELPQPMLDWLRETVTREYNNAAQDPETAGPYRAFLQAKFPFLSET